MLESKQNVIPWLMKWEKKHHKNFEIKSNVFQKPFGNKNHKQTKPRKPQTKTPQKPQPTRCFIISKELPRSSTWGAVSALPWNAGSGAFH